jgi:DNA-binding phage protein
MPKQAITSPKAVRKLPKAASRLKDRAKPKAINRLRAVLLHVPYYSIQGTARLAEDTDLYSVAIHRLMTQKCQPRYHTAEIVAEAISKRMGRTISAREIFSPDGTFPTPSTCALLGCKGCLPPTDFPNLSTQKPGDWCYFLGISRSQEQTFNLQEQI